MMFLSNMKIEELIKEIFKNDGELTDFQLILRIWELQGLKLEDQQKMYILARCSPPETITRARRKVCE